MTSFIEEIPGPLRTTVCIKLGEDSINELLKFSTNEISAVLILQARNGADYPKG